MFCTWAEVYTRAPCTKGSTASGMKEGDSRDEKGRQQGRDEVQDARGGHWQAARAANCTAHVRAYDGRALLPGTG